MSDKTTIISENGLKGWGGSSYLSLDSLQGVGRYCQDSGIAIFQDRLSDSSQSIDQLNSLVSIAKSDNWRKAVDQICGTEMSHYVTEDKRHTYLSLLGLNAEERVLEIGCGLGQCTVQLSSVCDTIVAMDVVPQQVEFTKLRCEQSGFYSGHYAVGGQNGELPFKDGVFDAVIFNLVLEWCGSRSDESHLAIQTRFLSEIFRVLRPHGRAWISTKNRYSIRLLLGGRDEHMSNMRFGSCLPQWIGRPLLRYRGHRKSDGLLHSHHRLRQMILSVGFQDAIAYWAIPEPRYVDEFVLANPISIKKARSRDIPKLGPGRWMSRMMAWIPAPFVPLVAPGNCFIALKK